MIEVKDLSKTYPNGVKALDNISFSIERGEVCGYLGANGAGKSTTVKLLCGMLKPDNGFMKVNGINVTEDPQKVKKFIGYVPESASLMLSLTPYDFLEFVCKIYEIGKDVYKKRIYDFAEYFSLSKELNSPMAGFSKGMCQKVLLISSLIHNPEVIYWDEPLSGLDFNTIQLIQNLIKELSQLGKTFFYCSHILGLAEKVCTKFIILDKSRIVYDGKAGENTLNIEELYSKFVTDGNKSSVLTSIFTKPSP